MDARRLFRQTSLARLDSPERLDEAAQVATSSHWLGLIGCAVVALVAMAWAVTGSIATRVPARGMIVHAEGLASVVSGTSGVVASLEARPGDELVPGQVVARVAQPAQLERIRLAEAALQDAVAARDRAVPLRRRQANLDVEAIAKQRAAALDEITALHAQAAALREQLPAYDRLLQRGLITRQRTLETRQQIMSLETRIAAADASARQLQARIFESHTAAADADVDLSDRVRQQARAVDALRRELATTAQVITSTGGRVVALAVEAGTHVTAGDRVLTVERTSDVLQALLYVGAEHAVDVRPGMEVRLVAGTGRTGGEFVPGRVAAVDGFPASRAAMLRRLQNDVLVESLTASGPVLEVRVDVPPTAGAGSRAGRLRASIASGSLTTADIVIGTRRPIDVIWRQIGGE